MFLTCRFIVACHIKVGGSSTICESQANKLLEIADFINMPEAMVNDVGRDQIFITDRRKYKIVVNRLPLAEVVCLRHIRGVWLVFGVSMNLTVWYVLLSYSLIPRLYHCVLTKSCDS
jgi:hypothetical protein